VTVREAKKGRVKHVNGCNHYYLRCADCRREWNVSAEQELNGAYKCPECE